MSMVPVRIFEALLADDDSPELEVFFWKVVPFKDGNVYEYVRKPIRRRQKAREPWQADTFIEAEITVGIKATYEGKYRGQPFQFGFDARERVAVLWYDTPLLPASV